MALSPHICVFCMSDGESRAHMLLCCPFFGCIWDHFLSSLHLAWVMPSSLLDLLGKLYTTHPRDKNILLSLLHGIVWGISKEHNRRIFEGAAKSLPKVINAIIFEVELWVTAFLDFQGLSISDISKDWFFSIFYVA